MSGSLGNRRRVVAVAALLTIAFVLSLASGASAHDVTSIDVTCASVNVHFSGFPNAGVPVHIAIQVGAQPEIDDDVVVNSATSDVTVDISAATAGLAGATAPVVIDVTWTNFGPQHVHKSTSVSCGTGSTTSTTSTPVTTPQIFQVQFRACHLLHVGYQYFPANTTVNWSVWEKGARMSVGHFVTTPPSKGFHFLTQPIGMTFKKNVYKAQARFWWNTGSGPQHYFAIRVTDC